MGHDPLKSQKEALARITAPLDAAKARMNAPMEQVKARMREIGAVEKADGSLEFEGNQRDSHINLADMAAPGLHTLSVAATLAAGLIASGRSAFDATPEGALRAYTAVLDEIEKRGSKE